MQSRLLLLALTLAITTLSTTAFAQTPKQAPATKTATPTKAKTKVKATDSIQQTVYQCERGVTVPAAYINTASGESFAVINVEGKQIPMKIDVSASGARYVSIDETHGYRWHTKGKTAMLLHLEADHTAKETTVLNNCTE